FPEIKMAFRHSINRVYIIGGVDECLRVEKIINESAVQVKVIGYINPKEEKQEAGSEGLHRINEIIKINKVDELIFCSKDISSEDIMETMLAIEDNSVDYKIAPPESISIIGSNSINTAGDLYILDFNALNKGLNKRKKRLFDIIMAALLLATLPIHLIFVRNKLGLLKNIGMVILSKYSWVTINVKEHHHTNVKVKPGILTPIDLLKDKKENPDYVDRVNMAYARDYKLNNDLKIIFKNYKDLGRSAW
ncbi:MAG: hypothetical protein MI922_06140, partial [Bacteroidales bacterium]|nr:hypothetical protein [Bacteroidales bacterium]